jgi:predicted transcriptional regulator
MAETPHTTMRLDPETKAKLLELARAMGLSMASVVKLAVADYHRRRPRQNPGKKSGEGA